MMREKIHGQFQKHFGGSGEFYASAGRINLIGEHTDYNGGFVFPGAIDKGMMAEIRLNGTDRVRVYSVDLEDSAEFGFREEDAPSASWARYVFGVCREIIKRCGDVLKGFDAAFAGDVPLGAGMSSSAALESTFAFALNDMLELGIDKFELAHIGQSTEHNYCGVNCGIMDQFASAASWTSSHPFSARPAASSVWTAAQWNTNTSLSTPRATASCCLTRWSSMSWHRRPTTGAAPPARL